MPVEMAPVKSSNVESVGHDAASNTLHVKFKSGGHYTYPNVTPEKHKALVGAESVGKHLQQNIIGKKDHPHTKMESNGAG